MSGVDASGSLGRALLLGGSAPPSSRASPTQGLDLAKPARPKGRDGARRAVGTGVPGERPTARLRLKTMIRAYTDAKRVALVLAAVLTLLGRAPASPTTGQAPLRPAFATPGEAVAAYFTQIVRPALERKAPGEDTLTAFYLGLADRTRAELSEDQFTAFWKDVAARLARSGFTVSVSPSIGEPFESDTGGQALVHVTGTVHSLPIMGLAFLVVPVTAVLGCVPGLDPRRSPSSECLPDSWPRTLEGGGRFDAVFRVVREGQGWRLILPRGLVEEMRRLTPQPQVRRHVPNALATRGGLTVRVSEVVFARERSTAWLAIENASDAAIDLLNPLSLASLVGQGDVRAQTRIVRSTIPEAVPAHSSARAVLVFDPLPLETRRLLLSLPGIRLGEQEVSLTIEMTLLPHAGGGSDPVPAEPLLLYLLTAVRPD